MKLKKVFRYDDDPDDLMRVITTAHRGGGGLISVDIETEEGAAHVESVSRNNPVWNLRDDQTTPFERWLNHLITRLREETFVYSWIHEFSYRGFKFKATALSSRDEVEFFLDKDEAGEDLKISAFSLIDRVESALGGYDR
jgi:hypothetical protein